MTLTTLLVVAALGCNLSVAEAQRPTAPAPPESKRSLSPFFTPAPISPKAADADGFLRRWLLLDPISKPSRTNTNLTSVYVRKTLNADYFPDQFSVVPHDGDKVTVAGQPLTWHALDSTHFNVKLFRFAYGLNKATYGIVFWAVTLVDSPREIKGVRLAVGSNSASIWWLNGNETVDLFNDRHMIVDDVVSKRLTLHKGRNILRGGLINGPGLSDFCVRFIDENGHPIRDIASSLE